MVAVDVGEEWFVSASVDSREEFVRDKDVVKDFVSINVCGKWWCWGTVVFVDGICEFEVLAKFAEEGVIWNCGIEVSAEYYAFVLCNAIGEESIEVGLEVLSDFFWAMASFFSIRTIVLCDNGHAAVMFGASCTGLVCCDESYLASSAAIHSDVGPSS